MKRLLLLLLAGYSAFLSSAQCLSYPVSLQERVQSSSWIVLGKVVKKHPYSDSKGNIYNLNEIAVTAWTKNYRGQSTIFIITLGGILGNRAEISMPAVQLMLDHEYVFFVEADNTEMDDKNYRTVYPGYIQSLVYSDAQGALLYQSGRYRDIFTEAPMTEAELLQKISSFTGEQARKPDGTNYEARSSRENSPLAVSSFSPDTTYAGTITVGDFLTITGSGFGASLGTVAFPNANDGGATNIFPPDTSEYVTWNDTTIVVKVPTAAGTGTFVVNGTFSSPSPLTIGYSHLSINSTFFGFTDTTRQRYYLRDKDGMGGYTFEYNSTSGFDTNTAAVDAFERALTTWRCPNYINWRTSATSTTNEFASDGSNVIMFTGFSGGTLGVATSRFSASAIPGTCDLDSTIWWLNEIDIRFDSTPPLPWQYGPALPTSGEYDFESVAAHELGHAYGLGHRIASGEMMHYAIANGESNRTPVAFERTGTDVKLAYSIVPTCFNPAGSGVPMTVWDGTGCSALPVTLLGFNGSCKKQGVELRWETATEINSSHFEIERSNDGYSFQTIANVNAKGFSSLTLHYSHLDAGSKTGVNYYRLKMVDKDASFSYSRVVKVGCTVFEKTFGVLPNPAGNQIAVNSRGIKELRLLNIQGQELKRIYLNDGRNDIDLSRLPGGMYVFFAPETGQKIKIILIR